MAVKSAQEVLNLLGGVDAVRNYLRGIEPGSETDQDAQRSMLAAIAMLRGSGGVHDVMAVCEPELYAQAALLRCRMWTDAEDMKAEEIQAQIDQIILDLCYDERNKEE